MRRFVFSLLMASAFLVLASRIDMVYPESPISPVALIELRQLQIKRGTELWFPVVQWEIK